MRVSEPAFAVEHITMVIPFTDALRDGAPAPSVIMRFLVDRDLRRRLIARRRALVDELTALASLVQTANASPDGPRG